MDHFASSKYVHNHAVSLKREKETRFLFVVNLVNHNICMLSSNDSVRQNEPQRAFWARVLKATRLTDTCKENKAERKPHHGFVQPPPVPLVAKTSSVTGIA